MKKLIYLIIAITVLGLIFAGCNPAVPPAEQSVADDKVLADSCTTIQSGELLASDGSTITVGFDVWGYNYQGRMFKGGYCDAYRNAAWCQIYKEDYLEMKWNDAWLSNMDCDDDGLLDRHYGFTSYIGSGAWCTNHQSGEYVNDDGETCKWNYFVKIVAVPADATLGPLVGQDEWGEDIYFWYGADETEIGRQIWGAFAIIQEVENDPCAGSHGAQYISPYDTGFDQYGPE